MSGLITAEFRKISTINLWWALLIPVVALSFIATWAGSAFGALGEISQSSSQPLPVGLLTMSMSTNFSTIFAALFGVLAVSGEHRNKTITTTLLTANPRGAVFGAKLVTYTSVGVVYGVANVVFASLGALLGAGTDGLGHLGDWFSVGGAGLLAMVLWTLLGVGFGTLVTNSVAAVLVPLGYKFIFEFLVTTFMLGTNASSATAYFPGAAGSGIVGNVAVPVFFSAATGGQADQIPRLSFDFMHFFAGGTHEQPWWASLLIFTGYGALFVVGGWLAWRRRDVT